MTVTVDMIEKWHPETIRDQVTALKTAGNQVNDCRTEFTDVTDIGNAWRGQASGQAKTCADRLAGSLGRLATCTLMSASALDGFAQAIEYAQSEIRVWKQIIEVNAAIPLTMGPDGTYPIPSRDSILPPAATHPNIDPLFDANAIAAGWPPDTNLKFDEYIGLLERANREVPPSLQTVTAADTSCATSLLDLGSEMAGAVYSPLLSVSGQYGMDSPAWALARESAQVGMNTFDTPPGTVVGWINDELQATYVPADSDQPWNPMPTLATYSSAVVDIPEELKPNGWKDALGLAATVASVAAFFVAPEAAPFEATMAAMGITTTAARTEALLALSTRTAAGRSWITAEDTNVASWAHTLDPVPGRYVLSMHGGPAGVRLGSELMDGAQLAKIVKADPTWKGEPITLAACRSPQVAQDLANKLGVDVVFPSDLGIGYNGTLASTSYRLDEAGQIILRKDGTPALEWPPTGTMNTAHPAK